LFLLLGGSAGLQPCEKHSKYKGFSPGPSFRGPQSSFFRSMFSRGGLLFGSTPLFQQPQVLRMISPEKAWPVQMWVVGW
jgi:hypothetical protein